MLSECSDYVVSTRHKIHIRVEYNVFPVVCIQQHIDYIHSVSVGNDAFHVLKIKLITIMIAHTGFQINFLCIIANWATEILRLLAQIKKQ